MLNQIADLRDPSDPQGRSYRQINEAKQHGIPIGSLVKLLSDEYDDYDRADYRGVRLYVVAHTRDCDGTPLYCMAANKHDTIVEREGFRNASWISGWPEYALKVVPL